MRSSTFSHQINERVLCLNPSLPVSNPGQIFLLLLRKQESWLRMENQMLILNEGEVPCDHYPGPKPWGPKPRGRLGFAHIGQVVTDNHGDTHHQVTHAPSRPFSNNNDTNQKSTCFYSHRAPVTRLMNSVNSNMPLPTRADHSP